jgi:hypothetical protein
LTKEIDFVKINKGGKLKRLKIDLDTSIINFLFADDSPDFKRITREGYLKKMSFLSPLEVEYEDE